MGRIRQKHFTDSEIRPAHLKSHMRKAQMEDIHYLYSKKKFFINVVCPACGSKNNNKMFNKFSFNFVSCNDCLTVFMNPRAPQNILADFYKNSRLYEYWSKYVFPLSLKAREQKIFKPRVDRLITICNKYQIEKGSLAEVGPGYGFFLKILKQKKYFLRLTAIEPSVVLANQCKKYGVKVIQKAVEEVNFKQQKFNIIACFEVIEHLFNPFNTLISCYNLLNNKGLLVITCPNFKGFDIEQIGKISDSIDAEHINLFNPHSISILLKRIGFNILEIATPGELDAEIVRNKILAKEYNIVNQPFLKNILIDNWEKLGQSFQKFLQNNLLSSHMWVVAQK